MVGRGGSGTGSGCGSGSGSGSGSVQPQFIASTGSNTNTPLIDNSDVDQVVVPDERMTLLKLLAEKNYSFSKNPPKTRQKDKGEPLEELFEIEDGSFVVNVFHEIKACARASYTEFRMKFVNSKVWGDRRKIFLPDLGLEIGGDMNLAAGIQVAQLALKHRQNKKQQQRIIVFAGSPVKHEKKVLEMIGRKLKKNSVALDIVNFGEEDEGKTEKLEALLAAVNNNDTSHIVHVPAGTNALSDVLISTPIFTGDGEGGSGFAAAAAAAAAGGVSGFEFGVDPNLDPELALALRVSMEEERARQEAAAKKAAEEASKQEKGGEQQASSQDATMTERASASASEAETKTNDMMDDENALLQQALAMSMDDPAINQEAKDTDMSEAASDDPELALALQLSVADSSKDSSSQSDMSKLLADQSFVSSILASLPGVDPNDPSVKDLLASMQNQSESQQKNDDKKPPSEEEKK